jgi:hypothetical protein
MTENLDTVIVPLSHDREVRIIIDEKGGIDQLSVDTPGQSRFG